MTVHPDIIKRNHTFAANHDAAVAPVGGQGEGAAVGAYFILFVRNQRRVLAEVEQGVVEFVGFVHVDSRAVSLTFPVAGDIDVRPSTGIERRFIEILRAEVGVLHPMEFPCTIQAHIVR